MVSVQRDFKEAATMKKIICLFKGHKRSNTKYHNKRWDITCSRCGYKISYKSPRARLVGLEQHFGFDGR
jgi:DNA-directed RNA polymerase subunit RPC12/RpoP